MKKTLTILTILVVALIAMMGSVNAAATLGVKQEGNIVTVTLSLAEASNKVQFNLTYKNALLTYDSIKVGDLGMVEVNTDEAGLLKIAALGSGNQKANSVTITFKVNEGAEGKEADFAISNFKGTTETLVNTATSLTIEKTSTTPTTPTTPEQQTPTTTPTTPTQSTQSTNNNSAKVGTNGKTLTKLPQTGTPLYAVAVAVIVAGVIALAVRKIRK